MQQPPSTLPRAASAAGQVRDLVSPGVLWCVERGLPINLTDARPVRLPRAFVAATRKYSGQVSLGADGVSLRGYVAGAPFPDIDAADPKAAIKVILNYYMHWALDDLDVRNFDADTGVISSARTLRVERHFLFGHLRRLYYVGRLYVDPKPELPSKEEFFYKETLHPFVEPFDLKGVGFTYYRYWDASKQDDSWLYLPSLRRVRRLSIVQRSDTLFGQDWDQDSYFGFAAAPGLFDRKLLGERDVLGAFQTTSLPVKWAGGGWAFDAEWSRRRAWVLEATSKLPYTAFSKRVIYVDQDNYMIPYTDMYDQAGELWKVAINAYKWSNAPFPGAPVRYQEARPFIPGSVMVDIPLEHATKWSLPSHSFPGEPGWYWHQGSGAGTTEDQFTIAELIKAGRR